MHATNSIVLLDMIAGAKWQSTGGMAHLTPLFRASCCCSAWRRLAWRLASMPLANLHTFTAQS